MPTQSGNLHWNRMRLPLDSGANNIDTGLTLVNLGYGALEPPIGIQADAEPAAGAEPASRVMVIPMAPIDNWQGITHGEPWFDTDTNTVHVTFDNANEGEVEINVLFWNPHTVISPGQADTYNAEA